MPALLYSKDEGMAERFREKQDPNASPWLVLDPAIGRPGTALTLEQASDFSDRLITWGIGSFLTFAQEGWILIIPQYDWSSVLVLDTKERAEVYVKRECRP